MRTRCVWLIIHVPKPYCTQEVNKRKEAVRDLEAARAELDKLQKQGQTLQRMMAELQVRESIQVPVAEATTQQHAHVRPCSPTSQGITPGRATCQPILLTCAFESAGRQQ
jgi:hypothetical protein